MDQDNALKLFFGGLFYRDDFAAFGKVCAGQKILAGILAFPGLVFYQRSAAVRADLDGFGII